MMTGTKAWNGTKDPFGRLTWDDLENFAGRRIVERGQAYHKRGVVTDLAGLDDGALMAWVRGGRRYATKVSLDGDGQLVSVCTCPYGGNCKHAVAVVLSFLDLLKSKQEIPHASADDERLEKLSEAESHLEKGLEDDNKIGDYGDEDVDAWDDDDDDGEDGTSDEDDEPAAACPPRARRRHAALSTYLKGLTKEQLTGLVEDLADEFDDVRGLLEHRSEMAMGDPAVLLKKVRSAIRALQEPAWDDLGNGTASADLGRLEEMLEALLASGHADALVEIGPELLAGATRAAGSDHEGESCYALGRCLALVFRAAPQSSLSTEEQVDFAIQMELSEDYDLCGSAPDEVLQKEYPRKVWQAVAARLRERLKKLRPRKDEDAFSRDYRRERLTDWLIKTLELGGLDDEVVPLCEREAPVTKSYVRLVDHLLAAGRLEQAEQWCRRGVADTASSLPGIAHALRNKLEEIFSQRGDHLRAVAIKADLFFESPSLASHSSLCRAARAADVGEAVDAWARHYLVTGQLPCVTEVQGSAKAKAGRARPSTNGPGVPWPLPATGLALDRRHGSSRAPMTDVLIHIAIAEKKPDEVLRWYDDSSRRGRGYLGALDGEVAAAVAKTHPDRAIAIYKKQAQNSISTVSPGGYERAMSPLREVRRILLRCDRTREWNEYLAKLREENRRRPRCLEVLNRLEKGSRPIFEE